MNQKEHERRMVFARQAAAGAWCHSDDSSEANFKKNDTANLIMNPALAEAFANILVGPMYEPHLGCATTGDLVDEIRTRIEIDGGLEYTTVGQD